MSIIKSVYIETTIPSFATSRPSGNTIVAGRQAATILFWENERHKYDLYVSQFVIDECSLGDADAAKRRLNFIIGIPDKAKTDCFHLASCVIAEIDYLLSWNCTHLGIHTYSKIQKYNEKNGLSVPFLITPEALITIEERIE